MKGDKLPKRPKLPREVLWEHFNKEAEKLDTHIDNIQKVKINDWTYFQSERIGAFKDFWLPLIVTVAVSIPAALVCSLLTLWLNTR